MRTVGFLSRPAAPAGLSLLPAGTAPGLPAGTHGSQGRFQPHLGPGHVSLLTPGCSDPAVCSSPLSPTGRAHHAQPNAALAGRVVPRAAGTAGCQGAPAAQGRASGGTHGETAKCNEILKICPPD